MAEGGALLRRYTGKTRIEGSNPSLSATLFVGKLRQARRLPSAMKCKHFPGLAGLILAAFVFMQASVVLAGCGAEAPALGQASMEHESEPCCAEPVPSIEAMNGNLCLAHCTGGFHAFGLPVVLVASPSAPAFILPWVDRSTRLTASLRRPPPSAVPPRILYRTLLI